MSTSVPKFVSKAKPVIAVHEFGMAPTVVPQGYQFERNFRGTVEQAQFRFTGKPVCLVKSAAIEGKPDVFDIGVFSWKPKFERCPTTGGWVVTNIVYAEDLFGGVSNDFPDKKWRIVRDVLGNGTGDPERPVPTFATRDLAARAELAQMHNGRVESASEVGRSSSSLPASQLDIDAQAVDLGNAKAERLYEVTLGWVPGGLVDGFFHDTVWALDAASAIQAVATKMSTMNESCCVDDDERAVFVRFAVAGALRQSAKLASATLRSTVALLLKGQSGEFTAESEEHFKVISAILKNYAAI